VKSVVVDETDHRIIGILVRNGRTSFAALGEAVGLSPHGAADRVRRLERGGVITGFTANVDLENLGRGLDAFVDVRMLPTADPEAFERLAAEAPAVREVLFVTGRFDYQLRLACTDADELDRTIRVLRQRGGVAATETRIVLRSSPRT
jgi:Lrp/AsnC family leucine-responsive transcriptional regulator